MYISVSIADTSILQNTKDAEDTNAMSEVNKNTFPNICR
jgi:hypothetical protein